jgi:hypothetical protein
MKLIRALLALTLTIAPASAASAQTCSFALGFAALHELIA